MAATGGDLPPAAARSAQGARRRNTRARLLAAAAEAFSREGYSGVSVEDIAASAGVSRMTFYRHFSGKVELSLELFRQAAAQARPLYLEIRDADYRDRARVAAWITGLFEADRECRSLLRVFSQAAAEGAGFAEGAQVMIGELIAELGERIPAFAVHRERPATERRRWLEAWLLLYEILDQSNHAALDSGVAGDPLVIDILADRFLRFVNADAAGR